MRCMPCVRSEALGSTLKLRDPDDRTKLASRDEATKEASVVTKKPCSITVFPSQFAERILELLSVFPASSLPELRL